MPTTTAPDIAAAPSHRRYSGELSRSTPMCGGASTPARLPKNAARRFDCSTRSRNDHELSAKRMAGLSSPARLSRGCAAVVITSAHQTGPQRLVGALGEVDQWLPDLAHRRAPLICDRLQRPQIEIEDPG